jgi:hypothetical protein
MRALIIAIIAMHLLTNAPAATAAPVCINKEGDATRCGAAGAMPVGWTLSPQQAWERQRSAPAGPSTSEILKVFIGLGLFFAMIALMPEFDGAPDGWDRQEDDDESRN